MKKTAFYFLLIVLMASYACDKKRFFDETTKIPVNGWHKDSAAVFNVKITDTLRFYRFFINLRHNDNYRYSNFYLFLNTRLPDGLRTRDTIEMTIADFTGKWLGKGFGTLRDNQILIRENLRFPRKGTYHFTIEQAMREEVLKGIENVGIRVERQ
jgi:gliding motility-associated lipoprotein GldH